MNYLTFLHTKFLTLISYLLLLTITACLFQTELRFMHDSPIEMAISLESELEEAESEKEVDIDEFIHIHNEENLVLDFSFNNCFSDLSFFISHQIKIDSPPPEFV